MENATRQRIKYLVEHGELYPQEAPMAKSLAVKLLGLLAFLQVVEIAILLLK